MKNSSIEISLTVDSGQVKTGLAKVQADFSAASSKISQALSSIKGFAALKKQTADLAKDYGAAQQKVAEIARKMATGAGGAALAKDFDIAKQAAAKLKTSLSSHQQALQTMRGSMAAAGVATSGLSGRQAALRKELEATRTKYQALAATASARTTLGLTAHGDIAKEIDRAKAAYATLRASGTATVAELAQAKVRLRERIDELREGTNGWRTSLGNVKMGLVEIAAVVAPTVLAISQAIKFESAMADVKKVVDGTPQELEKLRGELLALTRIIPMTAEELAAIAAAGGQLGIAGQDIGKFVQVTAKMATAFNMTAQEAGEAIGKIKTLYGLNINEIEAFGDTINRLGNTTAARERDIVDVMLRIGGSVRQVGMGNDQAAALAATMLSLGMQTEVAGTAINTMINRLQTGTMQGGEFQAALEKIGLNAGDMAAMISSSPQQAIDTLLTSLEKLSGQEQAEVLTGLFGREHQDEIARLVTGVKAYRDSLANLADQSKVTGGMNREFEERAKTTAAQLQLLKNSVNEAGINLGSVFLPAIRAIIAPITSGIQLLADFSAEFPKLSAAMVTIGTGAVAFGTIVKVAGIARLAVLSMKADVLATFVAIRASSLSAWAASTITAIRSVNLAALPLLGTFGLLAGAFWVGWKIGELLNKFDIVKKAGITLAAVLTKAWLRAKLAWADFTGGDSEAIRRKIREADQIYGEMFADVGKQAKETAKIQVKAHQDAAAAAEESADKQGKVTGEALNEMKKAYREYASEVKRLQGEIVSLEISADQQIRDLKRSTMSAPDAWEDEKKQAEEYAIVAKNAGETARLALEGGDTDKAKELFKVAQEYADMAREAFANLGDEVKEGDKIFVSQAEAVKTAVDGIKSSVKIKTEAIKGMQEAAHAAMEELTQKSGFEDLSKGMDEAERKWLKNWQNMRAKAISDIKAVEDRLAKIKDKEVTVYINEKVRKAAGGPIGAIRMATGGAVQTVRNMLSGGHFPGFGGGDRRHVVAEDGEYMLDKFRVRDAGLRTVQAFHAGRYDVVIDELRKKMRRTVRRQIGGIINNLPVLPPMGSQFMAAGGPVLGGAAAAGGDTYNFHFPANMPAASRQSAREQARMFLAEMQKMHKGASR